MSCLLVNGYHPKRWHREEVSTICRTCLFEDEHRTSLSSHIRKLTIQMNITHLKYLQNKKLPTSCRLKSQSSKGTSLLLNLTIIHLFKHFGLLGLLYLIYLVVFSLVLLVCPRAVTEFLTILCNLIQIIRIFIFLNSGIQLIQPILPPLTSSTFWIVIHTVLKQRSMDSYNLCILVYPFKHSQIHKHLGPFNFSIEPP